ncbi:hypothetical protein [Comamonas sp.]|uniref:hypothetical protein n=1 Tax=Comamonas sp. TaxID=34028 RepID=UPI00289A68FA|nr:hypothetical protein [Comamonas sp.]
MQYDNPAGRLHAILTELIAFPDQSQARDAWGKVFRLPKGELGHVLAEKVARTMLLPYEAVAMLNDDHPELHDVSPSWVSRVVSGLISHNVHGTMETLKRHVTPDVLVDLRMTAAMLQKGSRRKLLSEDNLEQIRVKVSDLLAEVLNSDIDEQVKVYLVRSLRKILIAVEEYQLTGATALLENVEQMLGHAGVDAEYKSFLVDTELGKKVLDTLGVAGNLMTVAVGLPQLAMSWQALLA